jgi:crotonobetainyl-CoA:carnitine CoA-transferase CaiB-like acyl-CoA transferase
VNKPLHGIKVLDLSRIIAGPFCTMHLADMGAEVIKVENPKTGDDLRNIPPFKDGGESAYFLLNNRNKKSITLNLKNPKGKVVLEKLIIDADVVIQNFRPGVMEKLGFTYEKMAEINPRIIYCSISGYGDDNHSGAYDPIVQGESGIMSVNGDPDGSPVKVGVPVGDLMASLYAVSGILCAILTRNSTGKGQHIEISLLDSLVSLLALPASIYVGLGQNPPRVGNGHPGFNPYDLYETKDGYINIACGNDNLWQKFCDATGLEQYKEDPRFLTLNDRKENRNELQKIAKAVLKMKSTDEWVQLFNAHDVPNGRIRTIKEVFADDNLKRRKMIKTMNHPTAGIFEYMGNPVKMSAIPETEDCPPPILGEHTAPILKKLGYLTDEIAAMKREGVI